MLCVDSVVCFCIVLVVSSRGVFADLLICLLLAIFVFVDCFDLICGLWLFALLVVGFCSVDETVFCYWFVSVAGFWLVVYLRSCYFGFVD